MADATETPKPAEAAVAAPKAKGGAMLLLVIGVGGGVLGAVTGGLLIAPRFLGKPKAHAAAEADEGKDKSDKSDKGGKDDRAGEGRIVRIDNMIVNPAGSEGTRFLMVSVAFEVQDADAEKRLKQHEVELRDMVIGRLESLTMPMLTKPFARDTLKAQLGNAVRGLIGPKAKLRVFLPQFVIQ